MKRSATWSKLWTMKTMWLIGCYICLVGEIMGNVSDHSVHWVIKPSQHHPLFLAKSPLKSANCPSTLFRKSPSLYQFFVNSPLKVRFFYGRPKYESFSSSTSSYLLEVTKYLIKISQFEFLVMIGKNIFDYKLCH